jgi:hypothetical protein
MLVWPRMLLWPPRCDKRGFLPRGHSPDERAFARPASLVRSSQSLCEPTERVRDERAPSSRLPEPLLSTFLALLALLVHELGFWRREGSVSSPLTRLVPSLLALPRNLLALLVHKLVEKVTWVGRGGKSVGGGSSAAEW